MNIKFLLLFCIIGFQLFTNSCKANQEQKTQEKIIEKINYYTKKIKLEPDSNVNYELRGDYYSELKKYDLALQDYYKANTIREGAFTYFGIAKVELILGHNEKALQAISKSIELQPQTRNAYRLRGLCYDFLNIDKNAIKDYTEFLEPNSKVQIIAAEKEVFLLLYVRRAMILLRNNNYKAALDDINISIMIDKKSEDKNYNLYYIRYLIYDAMNKKAEAKEDLLTALKMGFTIEKKLNLIRQKYTGEEKIEIENLIKKYVSKPMDKEFDYENHQYIVETFFKENEE